MYSDGKNALIENEKRTEAIEVIPPESLSITDALMKILNSPAKNFDELVDERNKVCGKNLLKDA